jgi:hypothetical protein
MAREPREEIKLPNPKTKTPHREQPDRDTTHGHPGVPPKGYEAPKESRR